MTIALLIAALLSVPVGARAADELEQAIDLALRNIQDNEPEKAIEILRPFEDKNPENSVLQEILGYACEQLSRWEDALLHYEKAVELFPSNVFLYIALGRVYSALSNFVDAATYFKRALALDPDSAVICNHLGRTYEAVSDLDMAAEYYQRAAELDGSLSVSFENLANIYIKQKKYEKAVDALLTAVSLDPLSDTAFNNLSFAYYKLKKYNEALSALDRGLQNKPDSEILLQNRAFLVREMQQLGMEVPSAPPPRAAAPKPSADTAKSSEKSPSQAPASAPKQSEKQSVADEKHPSPVTDKKAAKPAAQPFKPVAISFAEDQTMKVVIPPLEPALTLLPLPSSELGDAMALLGEEAANPADFDPIELYEMKKKIPGMIIFEDKDRQLWRIRPASSGPRKMFAGIQPAADPKGKRIAYIDWRNLKSFNLYIYDFQTSIRTNLYSSSKPIRTPAFAPDGTAIAFIAINSDTSLSLLLVDLKTHKIFQIADKLNFTSYAWNPADYSIWLAFRECPPEIAAKGLCYARVDSQTGAIEYKTLAAKDAATGRDVDFLNMRKPAIAFSPDGGRLLVYDGSSLTDSFFLIDPDSGNAALKTLARPNGKKMRVRNIGWGYDGKSLTMNYFGNIWVMTPETENPVPAVTGFFVGSPAAWLP